MVDHVLENVLKDQYFNMMISVVSHAEVVIQQEEKIPPVQLVRFTPGA
jgi:hypothetical protein